ncbi:MAG: ATP-binding protein, partial [Acetatifactor sp.]|nr:ATP-binding protein [Acetatifactor sp.]
MKANKWIQDVQKIIGCEVPELLYVLAKIATEDNSRGLFARKCESKILECMEDVKFFLGEVRRSAQDFTLHDITHCINVIDFMGQMLVDIKVLNPAEISFFIYSALLHDIGMVKLPDEDTALDDLREDHGNRTARFIRERVLVNNGGTPFSFGEYDYIYMEYLPSICASHMQEFSFVEKMNENLAINGMEVDISLCAILLRLADAMDLRSNRAPYQLYKFIINRLISEEHWKKHMKISDCKINKNGVYQVDGICHDEAAHRCLYNHLDMIELEIEKVFKWKNGPHPRLKLRSHIVERNIKTNSYKMWHHSFSMDVLKITNLFMGEQLYGDKRLGLREIVQNSIDACIVRDEMNKKLGAKQDYTYKPEIYIIFDRENNQVIIRDNGTGMNDYIIQNYFLNIGSSYYSSNDFKKKNLKYSPSGYFGIGFLSAFMLSDDVYVRTAQWQDEVEYEFHFIKNDRFVTKTEKPKTFSGTEIRLNLDQFLEVFIEHDTLNNIFINTDVLLIRTMVQFIQNNFWNMKCEHFSKNAMLFSIKTKTFFEFAKENCNSKNRYYIDFSNYLIGIEGVICLKGNELLYRMKNLNNIIEPNLLSAIKKGDIFFSNNIREIFPFVKQFYQYDTSLGTINEFRENDYIGKHFKFVQFFFFPTEECKIRFDKRKRRESVLQDSKIEDYFSMYSWNCLCCTKYFIFDTLFFDIDFKISYNKKHFNSQENRIYN